MQELSCFKAYDVRGRIPDQLNEDIAYMVYAGVVLLIDWEASKERLCPLSSLC